MSTKRAIIFAINDYSGVSHDLSGPLNDQSLWQSMLTQRGWSVSTYKDGQVTCELVLATIQAACAAAQPGDHLMVVYSGHGSRIKDADGDESDGYDETLYLYDGNLVDDDLKGAIACLSPLARITFVLDCCHSGTGLRGLVKARTVPADIDGEARRRLGVPHPDIQGREVLMAACLPTEYALEGVINGSPYGAFSYSAVQILAANPDMTYRQFNEAIKRVLPSEEYNQHPQVECLEDMLDLPIL